MLQLADSCLARLQQTQGGTSTVVWPCERRSICSSPVVRRNISIGIPLDFSIPTEMTCIEPLVENEKSSKTPNKLKIMLCYFFSDRYDLVFTYSRCKDTQIHKIHNVSVENITCVYK